MKTKEIKAKKDSDLNKLLAEKRQELRLIRFRSAGSQSRDTDQSKKLRQTVSRILTEINSRQQL